MIQELPLWLPYVPASLALAAVAILGYIVVRRGRSPSGAPDGPSCREVERAQIVARELEKIAEAIRQNLATHDASVARFKERVRELQDRQVDEAGTRLCKEAEEMLQPTLRLASEIAQAYDEIRQQSTFLMSFTEVRTDPLTGARNRRALNEALEAMFAMKGRYDQPFSVALFDIDHFKRIADVHGHQCGDRVLQAVAGLLADTARTTDVVARYGREEFVVLMPQTDLAGAHLLAGRLREQVENNVFVDVKVTVSAGVAEGRHGEDAHTLLARAENALHRAKDAGRNCVCIDEEADLLENYLPPLTGVGAGSNGAAPQMAEH